MKNHIESNTWIEEFTATITVNTCFEEYFDLYKEGCFCLDSCEFFNIIKHCFDDFHQLPIHTKPDLEEIIYY